ncbi:transporter suffix domain-containing protein [Kitasatospora sp. NPDC089797]|uniref:transporter suffix domain-containing protein n=1 Tax=Kitasatospora sp. NPDC089797 TaxID=3155298 RepID=UPI00341F7305
MTAAPADPKRPLRFKIGVAFLLLSALLYLTVLVAFFLPLDGTTKTAAISGMVVTAEVSFLVGAAGVGKETVRAVKARLGFRKRDRQGARDGVDEKAPAAE